MDNTLILSLTAMLLGFAGIAIKICFASKCTSVEIGCIKVHRNVEIEPIHYDEESSVTSNNVKKFNE
jgi:hypothetical protein